MEHRALVPPAGGGQWNFSPLEKIPLPLPVVLIDHILVSFSFSFALIFPVLNLIHIFCITLYPGFSFHQLSHYFQVSLDLPYFYFCFDLSSVLPVLSLSSANHHVYF